MRFKFVLNTEEYGSLILNEEREVPKRLIERIVLNTGICFDQLFEIRPNRRKNDKAIVCK